MSANEKLAAKMVGKAITWVVFTGKLPAEIKTQLKVAAAKTGIKQQEIVAEAVEQWIKAKGLEF